MGSHGEIIVIFRTFDSDQLDLADGDEPPPQVNSIDDIVEQSSKFEEVISVSEQSNCELPDDFSYLCKVYDSASAKRVNEVSNFIANILRPKHEEFLPKNDIIEFYESLREIECDDLLEGDFAPESEVVAWNV